MSARVKAIYPGPVLAPRQAPAAHRARWWCTRGDAPVDMSFSLPCDAVPANDTRTVKR
jgi:hypothetical protein